MLSNAERKESQRLRTAKSRAKRKEQAASDLTAAEQRKSDEFDTWRTEQRLVSPGEREAFINAESVEDALQVAREFLLALGQPDVRSGETLLEIERRAVAAWCEKGAGLLNRNTLRIDTSTASTIDGYTFDFDQKWKPLSNEAIDVSTLPAIEVPEVVEVSPAADTPITVEDTVAPTIEEQRAMEHRHQTGLCRVTPELALMIRKQQESMDTLARKISEANLERELKNERRLGSAYIPASELDFRNSR